VANECSSRLAALAGVRVTGVADLDDLRLHSRSELDDDGGGACPTGLACQAICASDWFDAAGRFRLERRLGGIDIPTIAATAGDDSTAARSGWAAP
jgi:hypothetical protein